MGFGVIVICGTLVPFSVCDIVIVIFVRCYRHRLPLRPAGDARNALGVCTGTAREA